LISVAQGAELRGKLLIDGHITLHSQQQPIALDSLGDSFHTRLSAWLANQAAILEVSLPCPVNFEPSDQVSVTFAS